MKIMDELGGGKEGKIGDQHIDENILEQINQEALDRAKEQSYKERIY
jgi:hypothetical protein